MKKLNLLFLFLSFVTVTSFAQSERSVKANHSQSYINYKIFNAMHDVVGENKNVGATIQLNEQNEIIGTNITLKVEDFNSGNSTRDQQMKITLENEKFPQIIFKSTGIHSTGNDLVVKGNLTFHGITKGISVKAKKQTTGKQMKVTGEFWVDMTQFKVNPPSLMRFKTKKDMKIDFNLVFDL